MIYEYKLMWFVTLYIMYKTAKSLEIYIHILRVFPIRFAPPPLTHNVINIIGKHNFWRKNQEILLNFLLDNLVKQILHSDVLKRFHIQTNMSML